MNKNNKLNVRFASKEEGQQLILGNTQYYNRLTQVDIDWRARKENATLDELISFAQSQVLDFTQGEIDIVMGVIHFIEYRFYQFECKLPLPDEIVFVKTNMKDESNALAYTSGNMIFLNAHALFGLDTFRKELIAHELFHCLTRRSP